MKRAPAIACLALALACGGEPQTQAREPAPALEIGGQYHVTGVTIDPASGAQRPIQGRVNLVVAGDTYTTHFELRTVYPGTEKASASVVGTGEGSVDGSRLTGTAALQIVLATVPGVDPGFAMIPHEVGPRVVSSSVAEFFEDGSVRVELQNEPREGEVGYQPTRTVLVGHRVEDT